MSLASSSHHRILVPTSPLLSLSYTESPNDISASIEINCSCLNTKTSIKILGSCNGSVCLIDGAKDMIVYNPSTRKHCKMFPSSQQILHSSHQIEFVYGFGCSLNPDDLRVVRFPRFARDSENIKKVFGVGNSGALTHSYDFIDTVGTFLNGSVHWLAYHSGDDNKERVIASFSLSKDLFNDLSLPAQESSLPYYILGVLQGCLSVLCDDVHDKDVDVWLMKEYGAVNSWIIFVKIPLNMGIDNISYMMPLSSLNDDEILLEIDLQSFVVYDAKNKTFRDVTVEDLKWFGDAAVYVESLVSPEVSCVFYL